MSDRFDYYDDRWRSARFTCPDCGWTGSSNQMSHEIYRELMDFSCTNCGTILVIVPFPTVDETRRAAELGNPEAIQEVARLDHAASESSAPNGSECSSDELRTRRDVE